MVAPPTPPPALLVFDFDWSLIEENSDTWVIAKLGVDDAFRAGRAAGVPWTQLMDATLAEAAARGASRDDVEAAAGAAPLHPDLALLALDAAAAGVDVAVVSDANTVYIDVVLRRHGLQGAVGEVHTNPARWLDGALRVAPYHTAPHGCTRHCPANLCKGKVLAELLQRRTAAGRRYGRVLYVGDGRGDYCPSVLLLHGSPATAAGAAPPGAAQDAAAAAPPAPPPCGAAANRVFAREEYPDGVPCSLSVMLRSEPEQPSAAQAAPAATAEDGGEAAVAAAGTGGAPARVVHWRRPEQLAALLRSELGLAA